MFRRIHSKKNRPSLWLELKKEFGGYFESAGNRIEKSLIEYPKTVFVAMLSVMLLSAVLAFTVMRSKEVKRIPVLPHYVHGDLGSVVRTGEALNDVLTLQSQISAILQKDSLTTSDTLILKKAFKQLESIQSKIKSKPQ